MSKMENEPKGLRWRAKSCGAMGLGRSIGARMRETLHGGAARGSMLGEFHPGRRCALPRLGGKGVVDGPDLRRDYISLQETTNFAIDGGSWAE